MGREGRGGEGTKPTRNGEKNPKPPKKQKKKRKEKKEEEGEGGGGALVPARPYVQPPSRSRRSATVSSSEGKRSAPRAASEPGVEEGCGAEGCSSPPGSDTS